MKKQQHEKESRNTTIFPRAFLKPSQLSWFLTNILLIKIETDNKSREWVSYRTSLSRNTAIKVKNTPESICEYGTVYRITPRDCDFFTYWAQARSQRPTWRGQKKYKRWSNIRKQRYILIVTQNSCKRICFFAKERRNSIKSNAAVRLFSNVRWSRFACRAVVIDRRYGRSMPRAAMLSMTKTRHRETECIS